MDALLAEAAADVGRDDAQLGLGHAERVGGHELTDQMRHLRRVPQGVALVDGIVCADYGARLDRQVEDAVVDHPQPRDMGRRFERLRHGPGVAE